jgi:hypothetical protein
MTPAARNLEPETDIGQMTSTWTTFQSGLSRHVEL